MAEREGEAMDKLRDRWCVKGIMLGGLLGVMRGFVPCSLLVFILTKNWGLGFSVVAYVLGRFSNIMRFLDCNVMMGLMNVMPIWKWDGEMDKVGKLVRIFYTSRIFFLSFL